MILAEAEIVRVGDSSFHRHDAAAGACDNGEVMGVKHKDYNIFGVQFHPESILTKNGEKIIENFLKIGGGKHD